MISLGQYYLNKYIFQAEKAKASRAMDFINEECICGDCLLS
jgi:hypothetical protein